MVKIANQLAIRKINITKAKKTPRRIKIQPAIADDYRAATKWLESDRIHLRKPLDVILRDLPVEMDVEDIKVGLEELKS